MAKDNTVPDNTISTSRDKYLERLKAKYPDKQYADDEALFAQVGEDYDNYDKELDGYRQREQDMSNLFASDPRSAAFLTDWRKGEDPIRSLVRKYGPDLVTALNDPDKAEGLAEASKEYTERVTKEKEYDEQYTKNIQETLSIISQLQSEMGLSDDEVDKAMEFLLAIVKDGILGKFTKESISMALKAINHDQDVAVAEREAETRGRNAKIEEKLRNGHKTDGTPSLAGKNGGAAQRQVPDFGALNNYDDATKNIFERGGEKRTPIRR